MQHFLQLGSNVQTMPLMLAIQRLAKVQEVWKEDTYLRDYPQGPFANTESIILRFPDRSVHATEQALKEHEAGFDQHENFDQPIFKLLPEARPLIFQLMTAVQGERLGRVIINKLIPGGVIYPHEDTPVHAEYWDRFHIVLQSAPGSNFRAGEEWVHMQTGDVWWFNNRMNHEVINNSAEDRIHMVIDIRTSKP